MSVLRVRGRRSVASFVAAIAVASGLVMGSGSPAPADQDVVVSPTPEAKHPRVLDGRIYDIDNKGPDVLVGGTFTTIRNNASGSPNLAQGKLFKFSSDTGLIDQSFNPVFNGNVEAVTYTEDGQGILVAGAFTTIDGQPAQRIAKLHLNGTLDTSFTASAGTTVKDFALVGDRLILGGEFGKVNNQTVRGLAAIDPDTGAYDNSFNLPISESRDAYAPYVLDLDASPDGNWLVIGGNFKKVGGLTRYQVAVIDLSGASPKVAPWSTDMYERQCASVYNDTWIRGIDISPDSKWFVVNTTGAFFGNNTLCDTTARWELPPTKTGGGLEPTWVAHSGGDTHWAVEVTESAIYVGGHQRWANNPNPSPGGDNDGPGAVVRYGIHALDPYSGVPLSWNPSRDPRGRGIEAFHATDDYLMAGYDTIRWNGQLRERLAMLPVAGGTANPVPQNVPLPVNFFYTTSGNSMNRMPFDGANFGSVTTVSGPLQDGVNWSGTRDGFVQHGRLNYYGPAQAFYSRSFNGTTVGSSVTNLSTSVGYVDATHNLTPYDQPWGVAETRSAAFKDGRVLYTRTNSSTLFWRGHSLQSGILGGQEFVASSKDWSGARALEFVGDWLYAAWSDNRLYRFYAPDGLPQWGTRTLVSDGLTSGIPWALMTSLIATPISGGSMPPAPPTPPNCTGGSPWNVSFFANRTLSGAPAVVGCDDVINEAWGNGSPNSEIPSDQFSARYTRNLTLAETAQVKVTANSDDGVRVWIDGERVINTWTDGVFNGLTGTSPTLEPGNHKVVVEHYENGGGAFLAVALEIIPATPPPGPDTVAPDATITTPAKNSTVPAGTVTSTGTATDNVGVNQVRVGVRNRTTNQWLQANGTWGSTYAYRLASLSSPNATSTNWSINVNLPAGNYAFDARARDAAGNLDGSAAWQPFVAS
ncbi:PA14 domain-containing protein [Nocardioides sp. HM23]|uniref:PA14 domain-containing protein n=1 Tax=Nocardioides bizhenqiangii TaxID=3095076 RepID=UPI002ACA8D8D|nr:PA14 domain-containing protein [Nocardioides sp. HM23]MDZ5621530.1 PA14 domain-containing protein [Nocardioides sp. HM23]